MKKIFFLPLTFLVINYSFSQKTYTISYANNTMIKGVCNVFNTSPYYQFGGFNHIPGVSGVSTDGNNIRMLSTSMPSSDNSVDNGTAYIIQFPMSKDSIYTITVKASVKSSDPVSSPQMVLSTFLALPDAETTLPTQCGVVSYSHISPFTASAAAFSYINNHSASAQSYPFTISPITNFSYLGILVHQGSSTTVDTTLISSITIKTTPVSPLFSLLPTTINVPCDSTVPQTLSFTQTNSITNNGTLKFNWNFGNNSGWTYNGTEAPATLSTTSTTLTLTPDGTKTPSNFSVDEVYNGSVVQTFNVNVISKQPNYAILGNAQLCSPNTYSVDSLPNGSTVVWSASPSTAVSLSSSGNNVTVTPIVGSSAILTANVTTPCGNVVLNKNITLLNTLNVNNYTVSKSGSCPSNNASVSIGVTYNGNNLCNLGIIKAVDWQVIPNGSTPYQITWNQGIYNCSNIDKSGFSLVYNPPSQNNVPITFRFRLQNTCGIWSNWSPGYSIFTNSNCTTTGSRAFVSIFPNPSYSSMKISTTENSTQKAIIKSYKLYDASGRLIKSSSVKENENIDISQLKRGVYYLDILTSEGVEKHKFLKQ